MWITQHYYSWTLYNCFINRPTSTSTPLDDSTLEWFITYITYIISNNPIRLGKVLKKIDGFIQRSSDPSQPGRGMDTKKESKILIRPFGAQYIFPQQYTYFF